MWSTAAVGAFSRRTAVDVLQNRKWSSVARHHPFTPNEPDINTKFIQNKTLQYRHVHLRNRKCSPVLRRSSSFVLTASALNKT
jgi:hypothetical protein